MNLTPHFTLAEMTASATATARGIDNTPAADIVEHLARLAGELEKVRALLGGVPLKLHSCYRSPALNKAVGGATNSYHMLGLAADFDPPAGITHDQAQHAIGLDPHIDFDLVLEERAGDGAHWLHFQVPKDGVAGRRLLRDADLAHQGGAISRVSAG